jgi:hypothetical protein
MSDPVPPAIPCSLLALLRGRRAPHTDGYSAFDDVFHGPPIPETSAADRPWDDPALRRRQQHLRQIDPSYCNIDRDRRDLVRQACPIEQSRAGYEREKTQG